MAVITEISARFGFRYLHPNRPLRKVGQPKNESMKPLCSPIGFRSERELCAGTNPTSCAKGVSIGTKVFELIPKEQVRDLAK